MKSRHYRYLDGRFHQPDAVNGSTGSAMSWNLYSYVQNNPMNFIDPYGLKEKGQGTATVQAQGEKKPPKEQCEEDGGRYENCLCIFQDGTAKIYDAKEFENYLRESLLRQYAKALANGFLGSVSDFVDYVKNHISVTVTPFSLAGNYKEIPLGEGAETSGKISNLLTLWSINLSIGAQPSKGESKFEVGYGTLGKSSVISIGLYETHPPGSSYEHEEATGMGISISFGLSIGIPAVYFLLAGPY